MRQTTQCTAQLGDGRFCEASTAPDMPFPICARHALQVWRRMQEAVQNAPAEAVLDSVVDKGPKLRAKTSVIYYIRIGQHIKIGRTDRLAERIRSYPPTRKLLAVEPETDGITEDRRLLQFQHLLDAGREWFRPGPDLLKHIEYVRAAHGIRGVR